MIEAAASAIGTTPETALVAARPAATATTPSETGSSAAATDPNVRSRMSRVAGRLTSSTVRMPAILRASASAPILATPVWCTVAPVPATASDAARRRWSATGPARSAGRFTVVCSKTERRSADRWSWVVPDRPRTGPVCGTRLHAAATRRAAVTAASGVRAVTTAASTFGGVSPARSSAASACRGLSRPRLRGAQLVGLHGESANGERDHGQGPQQQGSPRMRNAPGGQRGSGARRTQMW